MINKPPTEKKKYVAWKAKYNGEPIDGTDRILTAVSKRAVIRHLAYEEGVVHQHNDILVRCKDGTRWNVSEI